MMKLKVCGLKDPDNLKMVLGQNPDYIGYIFYEKSPRFIGNRKFNVPQGAKKTGVFVNANFEFIKNKIKSHSLDAVQLHGDESVDLCNGIRSQSVEIIKAFGIDTTLDIELMTTYLKSCDYFLFDTKSRKHGGTGKRFDWSILHFYPFEKPFFISGGIDSIHISEIKKLSAKNPFLHGVDINSKFEIEPGIKNITKIAEFKTLLHDL